MTTRARLRPERIPGLVVPWIGKQLDERMHERRRPQPSNVGVGTDELEGLGGHRHRQRPQLGAEPRGAQLRRLQRDDDPAPTRRERRRI